VSARAAMADPEPGCSSAPTARFPERRAPVAKSARSAGSAVERVVARSCSHHRAIKYAATVVAATGSTEPSRAPGRAFSGPPSAGCRVFPGSRSSTRPLTADRALGETVVERGANRPRFRGFDLSPVCASHVRRVRCKSGRRSLGDGGPEQRVRNGAESSLAESQQMASSRP
jgi:hypothetical protein